MPATSVTCPFCNSTLKPKTPIPGGTRIRCPKCSTLFVVKADDAEEVPPTVAAPKKPAPRLGAPIPAAAPPPAPRPKPAAPRPAAVTPKPTAPKPPPAAPKPAAPKPPPAPAEEIVEIKEEEVVEITDAIDEEEPLEEIDDEAPARTGRKRCAKASIFKRFPMWVWLTGGGVALLVVLGGCTGVAFLAWSIFGGPSITKDNYDKIKMGSAEKDVTAIMGQPNASMEDMAKMAGMSAAPPTTGGAKVLIWKRGEDFMEVVLLQDKVLYKACKVGADVFSQVGF